MKNQKGITLIALVITIIVLLILAGVTISMVVGDNGILSKADRSKTKTERAKIVELARIDVGGQQGENLGSKLRKSELIDILNKYFTNVSEIENSSNILEETVTSKEEYGVYDIKVKEIYNNGFLDEENTTPSDFIELVFDGNGGSVSNIPATIRVEGATSITIPDTIPVRNDYVFLGWADTATSEPCYFVGSTVSAQGTKTIYAVWRSTRKADYTVHWYDVTGNILKGLETRSGTIGEGVSVTERDKLISGYTFDESNSNNILSTILSENEEENILKMYFKKNV